MSFSALEGATSLYQAERGDLSLILCRLRSDDELLIEEREFLADLIDGRRALFNNRPVNFAVKFRDEEMVLDVLVGKRLIPKRSHLVARVAKEHGVSPSYVYRKVRELEAAPIAYAAMNQRVELRLKTLRDLEEHFNRSLSVDECEPKSEG